MAEEGLPQLNAGHLIKDRYQVEKKLGEGGFGAVYKMRDTQTGQLYAMKVEGVKEQIQVLKMEVVVLTEIAKLGGIHVCKMLDRGRNDQFNYVIMTLVGQSLQDLKKACPENRLSIGSALRVGMQCMEALRDLHKIGYLHRDVKPGNFAIGREETGEQRNVIVLDFGLARKYLNDRGELRTPRAAAGFRGTVRYAPLNCHRSKELARKDDLEVWFYQQVELTMGRLPWREVQDKDEVQRWKERCRRDGSLFQGCPPQYAQMLQYVDQLQYWDEPNYAYLIDGIKHIMGSKGVKDEDPYDWEKGGANRAFTSRLPAPGFNPHGADPWVNF